MYLFFKILSTILVTLVIATAVVGAVCAFEIFFCKVRDKIKGVKE